MLCRVVCDSASTLRAAGREEVREREEGGGGEVDSSGVGEDVQDEGAGGREGGRGGGGEEGGEDDSRGWPMSAVTSASRWGAA